MRVLFFASDISIQSGASHALSLTMNRLLSRDVEVVLAAPDTPASREFFADFRGLVYFLRFERPRLTRKPITIWKFVISCLRTIIALRRILRDGAIDILHLNEITDIPFGLAGAMAGVPCVSHVRADGISGPQRRVLVALLRILTRRVLVPSMSTREWIAAQSPVVGSRTSVIYDCAFDSGRYDPAASGAEFRRKLNIAQGAPLVLLVSKFQIAKGHLCFIEAAERVAARCPEVRFLIIGDCVAGHEHEGAAIRQAARRGEECGYLRLAGVLPDLTNAYAAADILVHCPIYPDPYPTVTLIAMTMHKPVVASRIGGIPEQIEDQSSGLLFPPGDSEALAGLLIRLVNDPWQRDALGAEAGRRFREICDPAQQPENIIAVYQSVLPAESRARRSAAVAGVSP
jgi:glycosyltransferase involved in cell wall biosynthesis